MLTADPPITAHFQDQDRDRFLFFCMSRMLPIINTAVFGIPLFFQQPHEQRTEELDRGIGGLCEL